jgi:hypothetical protein
MKRRRSRSLALRNITPKWQRGAVHWRAALNQFAIL